jgi:phosphoribosylglycinamide formyltransferase 2
VALDFWVVFLADDGVYFSELSSHDTGMVTLQNTNFNEFELHLRAILSLPILKLPWRKAGDSAVILASENIKLLIRD